MEKPAIQKPQPTIPEKSLWNQIRENIVELRLVIHHWISVLLSKVLQNK